MTLDFAQAPEGVTNLGRRNDIHPFWGWGQTETAKLQKC